MRTTRSVQSVRSCSIRCTSRPTCSCRKGYRNLSHCCPLTMTTWACEQSVLRTGVRVFCTDSCRAVAVTNWQVDPRQWGASVAWTHQMADAQHASSGITQTVFALAEPNPFSIGLCSNTSSIDDIDAARSGNPDPSLLQLLESAPGEPTAGSMEGLVAIRIA